ncbi:hypothetical protein EJ04DRAFT_549893 [Polyplosphaeria fusca]|uniref:MARVEL domain-containing protein n=1 Tax=Polyplosphaeria fusca TaxID=682080 RepID=A0A9P4V6D4_9PLEO|nr:hypothetical protein EJ04DRAFT_549893 [Polyplosphaeria fusca]
MDTESGRPANVLPLPRWTLIIHAVQVVLAIIILGLSAYGVHWIAYNALIFALVVCICTFGCCAYIFVSSLFIHKLYNKFIILAAHIWMIIFWLVDLGLVANLARIWGAYENFGGYSYGGYCYYYCYNKRDLAKREDTTYGAYYGALAAGAFFAAVQFGLWVASAVIVGMYINKSNNNSTPPPAYPAAGGQAVAMDKPEGTYGYQANSVAPTPQPQPAQPSYVQQPQATYNQGYSSYTQDPVNREATVSPASELSSPHPGFNPNASELGAHK